jgi:hypothetical protein
VSCIGKGNSTYFFFERVFEPIFSGTVIIYITNNILIGEIMRNISGKEIEVGNIILVRANNFVPCLVTRIENNTLCGFKPGHWGLPLSEREITFVEDEYCPIVAIVDVWKSVDSEAVMFLVRKRLIADGGQSMFNDECRSKYSELLKKHGIYDKRRYEK